MKPFRFVFASALALLALAPPSAQQTQAELAPSLEGEVAGIRRALERLVSLLDAQRAQRDVEILLRRIELKERRLAPLQERLRASENEVNGLEDELRRMGTLKAEVDQRVDVAIREGTDRPDSEDRRMLSQIEPALKGLAEQMEIAAMRRRQAEDALAEAREEIEILDDLLADLLD